MDGFLNDENKFQIEYLIFLLGVSSPLFKTTFQTVSYNGFPVTVESFDK